MRSSGRTCVRFTENWFYIFVDIQSIGLENIWLLSFNTSRSVTGLFNMNPSELHDTNPCLGSREHFTHLLTAPRVKNFFWINTSSSRKTISRLETGMFHMNRVQSSSRIHFIHCLLSLVSDWHISHNLWIPKHTNVFILRPSICEFTVNMNLFDSFVLRHGWFLVNVIIWSGKEHDFCY